MKKAFCCLVVVLFCLLTPSYADIHATLAAEIQQSWNVAMPSAGNLVTGITPSGSHNSGSFAPSSIHDTVASWPISDAMKQPFLDKLSTVCLVATVNYQSFSLTIDMSTHTGVVERLAVACGKDDTSSNIDLAYVYAVVKGTLVQQHTDVSYSSCCRRVLGACVHHCTKHRQDPRAMTAAELAVVAQALEASAFQYAQKMSAVSLTHRALAWRDGADHALPQGYDVLWKLLKNVIQFLWDDSTCQRALHNTTTSSDMLQEAQALYQNLSASTSSMQISQLPVAQVLPFLSGYYNISHEETVVISKFVQSSLPGQVLLWERYIRSPLPPSPESNLSQHTTQYDSVLIQRHDNASFDLYTQGLLQTETDNVTAAPTSSSSSGISGKSLVTAVRVSVTSSSSPDPSRVYFSVKPACMGEVANSTLNVYVLLTAQAVARANTIPLVGAPLAARIPSSWLKTPEGSLTGVARPRVYALADPTPTPAPWDVFHSAVTAITSSIQSIISLFASKTTTTLIKKESCLSFDHFYQTTEYFTIDCLDDAHVADFVKLQFSDDLASWFGGDKDKMASIMLVWEYSHASNWTLDHFEVDNSAVQHPKSYHVFKNYDDVRHCSNWAVLQYSTEFQLADDVIYWQRSTSRMGGLFTNDKVIMQNVPHKITPQDVATLDLLMYAIAGGVIARQQGIPYTFPAIPGCSS